MISCGEPSGDLYAGALAVEIRRRQPDAAIFGLGGQRLMAGGGELLADYRGLSVTGLVEALRVLPKSLSTFNRLVEAARTEKPHALVVIDFPDFNFRLAAAVKKLGMPIIYYISPQLWAWRTEPDEGDEAARRPRAGDFSVRGTDLSRRRCARAVRRPSARRPGARAGTEGDAFCASSVSIRGGPIVALLPGQPSERSRAAAADHARRAWRRSPRSCRKRNS